MLIGVLTLAVVAFAQQTSVRVEAGALHVRAPGFGFIKGTPLARLKNGRAVRFDFVLNLLGQPTSDSFAETRQSCVVSYDLWEERFAVTRHNDAAALDFAPDDRPTPRSGVWITCRCR